MTKFHMSQLATVAMSVTLFASMALQGCVNDNGDKTILLLNNLAAATDDNKCVIEAKEDGVFRSRGRLSVDGPSRYLLFPLIKNLATDADGRLLAQRTFFGQGARVALSSVDPAVQAAIGSAGKFTTRSSFSTTPNGGITALTLAVVPPSVSTSIASVLSATKPTADIIATVEVFGLMGGGEVTSQPFDYPIEVCINCNVRDVGPCSALPTGFSGSPGNPCNPFQDGVVDCCSVGPDFVCPASKPM